MSSFREVEIGGIFVAPMVGNALAAFLILLLLKPLLRRAGFERFFSHPSVAELSIYVSILALVTIIGGGV